MMVMMVFGPDVNHQNPTINGPFPPYCCPLSTPTIIPTNRCADAMAPRCHAKTTPNSSSGASAASAAAGGGAATGTGAGGGVGGGGGRTTEQRAVAVARCMSAGEGCRSELRSKAVLALANAASFPFSEGLRDLVQARVERGGGGRGIAAARARLCRLNVGV